MDPVIAIPAFRDNYIWLIHDAARQHAVVVDPGDATPVETALARWRLTLVGVLTTHHHPDHVGGVEALVARRPEIPVWGPTGEHIPRRTHALADGDSITLPHIGLRLEVMDVPGHTAGHIAYHGGGMLFCGDTLFAGGCGRLFEGTPDQMHHSLSRLAALPGDTRVYCAHEYTEANLRFALAVEPDNERLQARYEQVRATRAEGGITLPSSLELELATNPFLRCNHAGVVAAARKQAGHDLTAPDSVFAVVRQWKDNF